MAQMSIFDPAEGERRKKAAIKKFEDRAWEWLKRARDAARDLCLECGSVTADDVIAKVGKPPVKYHPNVIGAVFANGEFVRVGYTKTMRPEGHRRVIGIWQIKDKP